MRRQSIISNSIYAISRHKYDNLGKLFYTNMWILINSSFGIAAQSITPQIAAQLTFTNLGQILTIINYLFMMISTLISPTYLKKLPYRYQFFLHATFSLQLCITGLFIALCGDECSGAIVYSGCILLSCFGGFIQGGLWVCQNIYISECTNESNRSFFFGFCNALSNSAQMIGSVLSAFLIKPLGNVNYFSILAVLCVITQVSFLFVLEPPGHKPFVTEHEYEKTIQNVIPKKQGFSINEEKWRDTYTLKDARISKADPIVKAKSYDTDLEIDTNSITSEIDARKAVIQRRIILQKEKADHEVIEFFHELPIKDQLKQIFDVAVGDKIRPLIPYMLMSGLILGFEYGVFYKLISESVQHTYASDFVGKSQLSIDGDINRDTFIVFGFQGVAEVFGGLLIGRLGQALTLNYAGLMQNGFVQVAIMITFMNSFYLNYPICMALGFLWGFADCAGQANIMALLSEDWGDDVRVYGFYNFLQNSGGMISLIISLSLAQEQFYYYTFLLIIWSILSNFNLHSYRRSRKVD